MVNPARSTSKQPNPDVQSLERFPAEGNLAWSERAALQMIGDTDARDHSFMVLLGGSDTLAFRLRVAQSHLRSDMLPSLWSEALLVRMKGRSLHGAKAAYVPLAQPEAPFFPPSENGVVEVPLSKFDDVRRYPNIALFALPIRQEDLFEQVKRFRSARSTLDTLEHILRWLAFSWGVARTGNPLHDNIGLPSACMLETVCAAQDFELTPALESRTSCPEAIWASMLHWHGYYANTGKKAVPLGRFSTRHKFEIIEPPDREKRKQREDVSQREATPSTARRRTRRAPNS
ncbi:hypothetical protein SAMN05443579_11079 [Variovorax sp. PDC80]|uniref:hypothetical protein n=1 Tax=Variovorax sp. PDC80 TaxID=1882827 RepID=UPI0008E3A0AA|nr:hypothetical protein [Variovorax sp. PDC80]SFP30023.1 hypothetical protein SAMN05443579_11079 [Variovorax sp. PDC80]